MRRRKTLLPDPRGTAASNPGIPGGANSTWVGRDARMWIEEALPHPAAPHTYRC